MKITSYIVWLGLLHGAADACTGFLLVSLAMPGGTPAGGTFMGGAPALHVGFLVLLYNVLAFALQPVIGWLLDAWRHRGRYAWGAVGGLGFIGAALLVARWTPYGAIVLAGTGSALFHVGGGAMAMSERRALHCGAFAAPGVIGQACGMSIALFTPPVFLGLAALSGVTALVLAKVKPPRLAIDAASNLAPEVPWTRLQLALLLLTLAIALRSSVWMLWQALVEGDKLLVVALPLAAGGGKLAGGYLAERWNATGYAVGVLALAALLLAIAGPLHGQAWQLGVLLTGIACLQSATPVALVALKTVMPHRPALAAGVGFGLAIALGGVPDVLGWDIQSVMLPVALASALLFYLATPTAAPHPVSA